MLERISQARAFPVALIVAPAGYGKSVALRQYLDTVSEPWVRFDMAPEHDSLSGFLRGLADAMHDVAPHMAGTLGDVLRGPAAGAELAAWLDAHVQEFRGVIAIDDLQHAHDPQVMAFLRAAIQRLKGRVTWLIASRSMPDLPVATWMTYGDMDLAVDEHDLAFTLDEARDASEGTCTGDDELSRFIEMTGGWATALSFAMRSRVRTAELAAIGTETREMVYRYLAEQVYAQLTDAEREMLQIAAYLPVIDVDILVDAGFPDAFAMLERLRKRVSFLSVEGDRKYRCHDLFRDFLEHQGNLVSAEAARSLRINIALIFERRGDSVAALRLYTGLRAEDAILRILQRDGFDLLDKAHKDDVQAAVSALSSHTAISAPTTYAIRGALEALNGRFDRAHSLLQKSIELTTDRITRAEISLRLALMLFTQSQDVIPVLEPLLGDDTTVSIDARVVSLLAPAYAFAGRYDDAKSAMAKTQYYAATVESDELRARLLHRIAIASLGLNLPLEHVSSLFAQAETIAIGKGLYNTAAAAFSGATSSEYMHRQDPEMIASRVPRMLDLAAKAGDITALQKALLAAFDAEAKCGRFDNVLELERRILAIYTTDRRPVDSMNSIRALRIAYNGHYEEAYRIAQCAATYYNFDRVLWKAMTALYALAIDKREESMALAGEAAAYIESERFEVPLAKCCAEIAGLLCVLVFALGGRIAVARKLFRRPSLISIAGVVEFRALVARALEPPFCLNEHEITSRAGALAGVGQAGIAKVINKILVDLARDKSSDTALTPAELHVLRELNRGRTPKEIAFETSRSVHTIRTLIQRATEKLGCSGRQQALAVARNRGWLDEAEGVSSALA